MWFQESLQTDFVQWILEKTVEFFYTWKMSFLCREHIFCLTTDKGSRAFLTLPIFYVNYIITTVVIYSYNYKSRAMTSQCYFENFVPIIFPCVDCPITFFSVSWSWCFLLEVQMEKNATRTISRVWKGRRNHITSISWLIGLLSTTKRYCNLGRPFSDFYPSFFFIFHFITHNHSK